MNTRGRRRSFRRLPSRAVSRDASRRSPETIWRAYYSRDARNSSEKKLLLHRLHFRGYARYYPGKRTTQHRGIQVNGIRDQDKGKRYCPERRGGPPVWLFRRPSVPGRSAPVEKTDRRWSLLNIARQPTLQWVSWFIPDQNARY